MTNSFVGFLNSIFVHLFLFAILTLDFSIFVPQKDRISTIPVEFITFPIEKENNSKKIENIKNESIEKNIRKKVLIEDSKVDKKKTTQF